VGLVASGAAKRVRTGGELTRFHAVGPWAWLGFVVSLAAGLDVRRDLIGAWLRPQQGVSAGRPLSQSGRKGDEKMMVLGADLHKGSHTVAAVEAATGELLGEKTIQVGARGLEWTRFDGHLMACVAWPRKDVSVDAENAPCVPR
jgi:hypothetical protein